MAPSRILAALSFIGVFVQSVTSQTCTPRPAGQLVQNSGFEDGDLSWSGNNNPVSTVPTHPSHSGSHMTVLGATYAKAPDAAAISSTSFVSQSLSATPGVTFAFRAFYNVVSYSKGASCPDTSLPLATCQMTITYAFQNIKTITLSLTGGYVDLSTPVLAETGGRSIQFSVSCQPATEAPQCAEVTVLLDDVTFSNAGNDCSWIPWGCYTDSTSLRSLPNHGIIPGWPATTTVEACCNACLNQGFWYAGLEYGNECWCGNGLGGSPATDGGCIMPCSGYPHQIDLWWTRSAECVP